MKRIRSLLCVPGHKPALFEKAAASAADCLMFDLEDSTPAHHKNFARHAVRDYLVACGGAIGKTIVVRINPEEALREEAIFAPLTAALVVPKIRDARDVSRFGCLVLPVIETPQAIVNLRAILGFPSVVGGIFGIADYAAGMGVSDRVFGDWNGAGFESMRFSYAKQKLATYAAAFGKQALDTCFVVKGELSSIYIRREWNTSRGYGFTGAACIHPGQIAPANDVFGPSEKEQAWAQKTHAEHTARNGEVGVDDEGLVVGMPVDRQARAIIGRSAA